jgi:hypothetical protein
VSEGEPVNGIRAAPGGQASDAPAWLQRRGKRKRGDKDDVPPAPDVAALARDVEILRKQAAADRLDTLWSHIFTERLASYRQAILRITGALDTATAGFEEAHVAQARTDALKTQLIGGAIAIGFAFGFEWAFAGMLGKLGTSAARIASTVELVENPANALVQAGVNVFGAKTAAESAERGKTPSLEGVDADQKADLGDGGALDFFTSNSEVLESHVQLIEKAFVNRSREMGKLTDEEWAAFDVDAQAVTYQKLFIDLAVSGSGVEHLIEKAEMATVIEKHLWALWIKGEIAPAHAEAVWDAQMEGEDEKVPLTASTAMSEAQMDDENEDEKAPLTASAAVWGARMEGEDERVPLTAVADELSLGTDIEARLNAIGVSAAAGVELSESWFEWNSDGWQEDLVSWAEGYNGKIVK